MTKVHLSGELICADATQAAAVTAHLDRHITLTRAEPGCESFEVTPGDASGTWRVDEWFVDAAAFAAHQARVAESEWGRATAGIERRYAIEGLDDQNT